MDAATGSVQGNWRTSTPDGALQMVADGRLDCAERELGAYTATAR